MITQEVFDNQTLAQSEFEEYVEELADAVAPEIEIDSVPNGTKKSSKLYRISATDFRAIKQCGDGAGDCS